MYEIPYQLARLGHEVRGYCLSYHGAADGQWTHDAAPGQLQWQSRSLGKFILPALAAWLLRMERELRAFQPDILIGASDIPHVVLGARLARKLEVPFVADLYDNFESFGQARIPGWVSLFRRAVRHADLVTTTSEALARLVRNEYLARGSVMAMPSTVDSSVFRPRSKPACRRELGLPTDAKLIGTAGGLYRAKGIGDLYTAWPVLAPRRPDVHLVLAGPTEPGFTPPIGSRVHYLGALEHESVAKLFVALDVGVICIHDTAFGRYCFPQKAYEMIACKLPIAGARLGVMPSLLADVPSSFYTSNDADDLARVLAQQLDRPAVSGAEIKGWAETISAIEPLLCRLVHS
ncbi:MAG: glycosyltransferase family 4 protein [Xanthomonadales bacterium]|nr:glycosyltransferase family 4 protein [Xanthomonadales bacterium]